MNRKLYATFILSAVLGLAGVFSTAALAGGDPPPFPPGGPILGPILDPLAPLPPVDPKDIVCRDIPNPVVEACKAEVKCYTGPVGGAFCSGQVPALCGQSGSVEDRAEAAVKMVVGAVVCKVIAPGNEAMMISSMAQMIESCGASAAGAPSQTAVSQFCDVIQALPDEICSDPGPATINVCKPSEDWLGVLLPPTVTNPVVLIPKIIDKIPLPAPPSPPSDWYDPRSWF